MRLRDYIIAGAALPTFVGGFLVADLFWGFRSPDLRAVWFWSSLTMAAIGALIYYGERAIRGKDLD